MSKEISTELGLSQPTNEPSQQDTIVMLAAFRQVPERFVIDIVSKILAESLSFEEEENTLPKELYHDAILEMLKVVRTYTPEEREELKNSALATLELLASSNIDETPWSKQLMQELSKMLPAGGDSDDEDDDGQWERPRKSIGRRAIFGGILSIGILVFSIFTSQIVDTPTPISFSIEDAQTPASSTALSLQSVPTTSTAITPLQKIQAETKTFVTQELVFQQGAEELRKEQEKGFEIISNARESIEAEAKESVDRFTNALNPTTTPTMGGLWSTTTPSRFLNPKLEEAHPVYKEARESAQRVLNTPSSTIDARLDTIYSLTTSLSTAITNSPKLVTDDLKKAIGELSRNLYDYAIRHELEVPRGRDYDESLREFVGRRFRRGEQQTRTQEMNELSFATYLTERVRSATTQILTTMDRCGMMMSMYGTAYDSFRKQAITSRGGAIEELDAIEGGEGEGEGEEEEASASTSIPGGVKLDILRSVELYKAIEDCKGILTEPELVRIKDAAVFRDLSRRLAGNIEVASALSQSIKNRISESITRVINTIQTATEFIHTTSPTEQTLDTLLSSLDEIPSWISPGDSIEFEHSTGTQRILVQDTSTVRNIENSFREQLGTFLRGPGRQGTLPERLTGLNRIIDRNFGADYGELRNAFMRDLNTNLQIPINNEVRMFIQEAIILPEQVDLFPENPSDSLHPITDEVLHYWNTDVMPSIATQSNLQHRNIRDSQTFIGQMRFWGWTRIGTPAIATFHTVSEGVLSGLSSLAGFMGEITRDAILVSVTILSGSAVVYYLIQRATSGALFNYLTCGICRRTVGGAPSEVQASMTATTQPQINIILPPYPGFSAGIQPGSALALPSSGASSTAMVPATASSPRPIRGHRDDTTPPPLPGMKWEWSPDPSPRDPEDGIWRQVPSSPAPATGRHRMTHKNKHTIHRTKKHTNRRTKTQKRGKGKGKNKGRHSKKHGK
jgi:hypothetical protein